MAAAVAEPRGADARDERDADLRAWSYPERLRRTRSAGRRTLPRAAPGGSRRPRRALGIGYHASARGAGAGGLRLQALVRRLPAGQLRHDDLRRIRLAA